MNLTLTQEELIEITGYKLASKQLDMLRAWGLPAQLRRNNTVSLGREHYTRWQTEQNRSGVQSPKLHLHRNCT